MYLKTGIFLIITLTVTSLLAVLQQKINLGFEKITLPQLAPAIAFLIIAWIFKDLTFAVNFDFNKAVAGKTLIAFVIPLLLFGISFFIGKQAGTNVEMTENLPSILPMMIIGILIGAVGEEIGWRAFLQPVLEKKHNVLIAAIIVGTIWGLWHVGHYKNGALFMLGFLLFTISASIIIAWILRETQYNIIIAAVFHIAVNLGFVLFFKNLLTDYKVMIINGIIWLIPAIILSVRFFIQIK
ncbi:MAG: CPBP family intramembrane metalloprotease [Prevotellaceae bacterium]|jgi:membrane protease YdiL (CAAX protease family)|nr:CPBP family intramembrane metalloprotease [Prevotellaceae bacterium]